MITPCYFNVTFIFELDPPSPPQITGAGSPVCYVQVALSSKVVTPPPPSRAKSSKVSNEASSASSPARAKSGPAKAQEDGEGMEVAGVPSEQSARKKLFDEPSVSRTSASSYSPPPPLSKTPPPSTSGATAAMVQRSPPGSSEEEEERRLCSETRRMLLCHQEHAMTLTELVECFTKEGDPASPTSELLYKVLKKATGIEGEKNPSQKKFEVCF